MKTNNQQNKTINTTMVAVKKTSVHKAVKCLEDTRKQVKGKLTSLSPGQMKKMNNFEVAIYNFSIKQATQKTIPRSWDDIRFRRIYLNKVRSIIANIKRDDSLLSLKATDVVFMDNHTMAPKVWEQAIANVDKMRDMMVIVREKGHEGMYQCRCRSKNTTFYQMQTRGADEPMTVFITCHDCDSHWKE